LCYWINGMSLTIFYFGDLNIWYMLVLAVICKYGCSGISSEPAAVVSL